jgi:hypothetical protein
MQLLLFISQEAVELLSQEQRLVRGEVKQCPFASFRARGMRLSSGV